MTEIVHKVIGCYKPTTKDGARIMRRLLEITAAAGVQPNPTQDAYWGSEHLEDDVVAELRSPRNCRGIARDGDPSTGWHRDNSGNGWLVIWASTKPTQVRMGRKMIRLKAGEVVVLNNEKAHHKGPKMPATGEFPDRWFFRQQIMPDPSLLSD